MRAAAARAASGAGTIDHAMTAQINDTVHFRGNDFALAEIDGGPLFDPADHGIEAMGICTACWRGFVCRYAVVDDRLTLDRLEVFVAGGSPPALFGVPPAVSADDMFNASYVGLYRPIPFNGRLTIADDFLQERYVHMGFQDASAYRNVWTLTFDRGALTQALDRSAEMAERRDSKRATQATPLDDLTRWIADRLSRKPRE